MKKMAQQKSSLEREDDAQMAKTCEKMPHLTISEENENQSMRSFSSIRLEKIEMSNYKNAGEIVGEWAAS